MPNTVSQRQPSVIPTGPVCDSADQCISACKQLPANDISAAASERVSRRPVFAAALPADGPCTVRSGCAPSPVRRLPAISGRLRQSSSLQHAPPEPVPAARAAPRAATPPDIVSSIAAPDPRAAAETQHCGPSAAASVYQPSRWIRRRRCAGHPVEPVDRTIPPTAAAAAAATTAPAAAQLRPRRIPTVPCGCWLRSPFLWSSTNVSPAPAVPRQLWPASLAAAAAPAPAATSDVREPSNAASVDSATGGRGRCSSSSCCCNRSTRRHCGKEGSSTLCEAQA